ncbi:MAG: glycosyltransferase family 4 protein [Planctomycetota bacterium]|jgi:glycosyltransferase involved in cell wall biosynthesis|nr:glycosyltransferase family 4 protein [Planctomycetota bacterium]MDP6988521.1 glycosyltransferase family 4 protein [Planctomycetota bacterium]
MRVMHVMESTIGGTRRHLVDLAGGLVERGLEVHLVVAAERQSDFRADLDRLADAGCGVRELAMVRSISPLRDPRHLRALEAILRAERPDVVHTHSSKAGVLGRLASIRTGIGRRVHTPHTLAFLFREMFGPVKRRAFLGLERWLGARTERVIAVSESEGRTVRESGIVAPERVRVIPNGVEVRAVGSRGPGLDLAGLGLDPARRCAAVVGLLNVAKGQDLAIDALAGLEDLQLLLVGHGEERAALERRARRRGVADRVCFAGFRPDVEAVLASVDLLLLPSRWEGMPYVVLEAMAAGLPVVATPVDGAVDLIEDGRSGWLATEITAAALAEALSQALAADAESLAAVGGRGRERVAREFTREGMVDGAAALYEELA